MAFADVLSVSLLLWATSFAVGYLPLLAHAQSRHRQWIHTVGVGILIGTAFVVTLPDGLHSMYEPPRAPLPSRLLPTSAGGVLALPTADLTLGDWIGSTTPTNDWKTPLNKFKVERPSDTHAQTAEAGGSTETSAAAAVAAAGHSHPAHPSDGHSHSHSSNPEPDDGADGVSRRLLSTASSSSSSHSHHHDDHSSEVSHEHESTLPLAASRVVDVDAAAAGSATVVTPAGDSSDDTDVASVTPVSSSSSSSSYRPVVVCFSESHGSRWMGASLAIGFVLMILIDRCSPRSPPDLVISDVETNSAPPPPLSSARNSSGGGGGIELKSRISVDKTGLSSPELRSSATHAITPSRASLAVPSHPTPTSSPSHHAHPHTPSMAAATAGGNQRFDPTVLVGPIIHSLIDGALIGAAGVASTAVVGPALLLSMMIHKAPLAFGVTSFMLYQGRTEADVKKQLLLYTLTAPIAAIFFFGLVGDTDLLSSGDGSARGLAILFSAGCVLFTIAVHVLPEIQSHHDGGHSHVAHSRGPSGGGGVSASPMRPAHNEEHATLLAHAHSPADASDEGKNMPWRYVWALIIGLLTPLACSYARQRQPLL